jgi:hypothetical protein
MKQVFKKDIRGNIVRLSDKKLLQIKYKLIKGYTHWLPFIMNERVMDILRKNNYEVSKEVLDKIIK